MGSEDFEYNTNTGIVYDVRGVERDVSKPDLEIIDKARIKLRGIKIPDMVLKNSWGELVNFPDIYFDLQQAKYRNICTARIFLDSGNLFIK